MSSFEAAQQSNLAEGAFDVDRIRRLTSLSHLEFHEEIHSTNTRGLKLAAAPEAAFPALILARRQTLGRGRGANRWWSSEGALTFSLVIAPAAEELPQRCWPLLSLMTGLAVSDAVRPRLPHALVGVKWPNDVHCNGRKLCGVLIESPGGSLPRLVIGVGINVNNSFHDAPEEIRLAGTSLWEETLRRHSLTDVVIDFLRSFEARRRQLVESPKRMLDDWRAECALTGRQVEVSAGSERIAGVCLGIDEHGALRVQTPSGERRCVAGTVLNWR